MNIPKYSIPQTLIIVNHNQLWIDTRTEEINEQIEKLKNDIKVYNAKISNLEEEEGFEEEDEETIQQYKIEITRLKNRIANYETEKDELGLVGISVFDFPLDQQFTLAQGNRKSIAIRAINIETLYYQVDGLNTTDDVAYVASSINPWSKNNIIGNISQTFHNMPRMFPWNGQQHITIWFLNSLGKYVEIPCIKGSIELELIIDNENTYAYE